MTNLEWYLLRDEVITLAQEQNKELFAKLKFENETLKEKCSR